VNVAKVRQIIQFDPAELTKVPNSSSTLMGVYQFRDQSVPLIDLKEALGYKDDDTGVDKPLVLVTEFNNLINCFLVDGVSRIHRVSWKNIRPLNPLLETLSTCLTGSVHLDKREILILDMERLVADINPDSATGTRQGGEEDTEGLRDKELEHIKIILAEDSTFIRGSLVNKLRESGIDVVKSFDNGEDAFKYVNSLKEKADNAGKNVCDYIDVIVTDIEMPRMDGLTLCKAVKEELGIRNLPVAAFSSLITPQMISKCESVGIDSYASKPDISGLKKIILECLDKRSS
jgi:two-component system chemotaxis response regulator CheV